MIDALYLLLFLRFQFVTAFAASATASNWDRTGKPFNPLLGETYELSRQVAIRCSHKLAEVRRCCFGVIQMFLWIFSSLGLFLMLKRSLDHIFLMFSGHVVQNMHPTTVIVSVINFVAEYNVYCL